MNKLTKFYNGILFLKKHKNNIEENLKLLNCKTVLNDINDQWSMLLIDYKYIYDESIINSLLKISNYIPLLQYIDSGDYGWGYKVYVNGTQVAEAYISYQTLFEIAEEVYESKYPNIVFKDFYMSDDFIEFYMSSGFLEFEKEILNSAMYNLRFQPHIKNSNVESLKNFNISD